MVEVEPRALSQLEGLLETLGQLPHRLFLFLDDLSLDPEDEAFHHLKALLEGSLEGPPENVLLLATSNRRHLVRRQGENPSPRGSPPRPGTSSKTPWPSPSASAWSSPSRPLTRRST
jgi:predicted AAA+ superfamily ATPase